MLLLNRIRVYFKYVILIGKVENILGFTIIADFQEIFRTFIARGLSTENQKGFEFKWKLF